MKNIQNVVFVSAVVLMLFLNWTCSSVQERSLSELPVSVTIKGDVFIDNQGRQITLNGINIVSKNKEEGYMYQSGEAMFSKLSSLGVNCIRLVIIWDGLEPEPGVYNEEYLKEIDTRIAWAKKHNIFVVLDMHQDLFSVKYSDGAPEWATLDEGKPHTTGVIWSDAYMMSAAVQTSFDNFWKNKPAPDGIGIQDHFSNVWKHVAKRYASNTTVIGYDLMNEPFPGTSGVQSTMILLKAFGELYYKEKGVLLSEEELMHMWADESRRMKALDLISTQENYHQVFSQLFELNREFETNHLQKMYQKVSAAIREVDTNHILFLEHSYYGNTGVESSIARVVLKNGDPDPLVAYAPHGYDLVTDTKAVASASKERVAYIYNQIYKKGKELKMPVWLGEWGAFYGNSITAIPVAENAIHLIEKYKFGNAYWSYNEDTDTLDFFNKILLRPYPYAVNGTLISYENDFDNLCFSMEWEESKVNKSATIVYVPRVSNLSPETLVSFKNEMLINIEGTDAGWLYVKYIGRKGSRKLLLKYVNN